MGTVHVRGLGTFTLPEGIDPDSRVLTPAGPVPLREQLQGLGRPGVAAVWLPPGWGFAKEDPRADLEVLRGAALPEVCP